MQQREFRHPDWSLKKGAFGEEIRFVPARRGARFVVPLLGALLVGGSCLYWLSLFLGDWLRGEEILAGAVVAALLLCGGLWFAAHCFRLAFRSELYVLGNSELVVKKQLGSLSSIKRIPKSTIVEIVRLHTPPKHAGQAGIWRTVLRFSSSRSAERSELALEGDSEDECKFLSERIARWRGIECRTENTME